MDLKRPANDEAEMSPNKRRTLHSNSQRTGRSAHAAVDQTYGQRNAFGSLDDIGTTAPAGDSDLDCEDDTEALAYLRLVRQEASGIPHVIVAKRAGPQPPPPSLASATNTHTEHAVDRAIYNDGTGDFRGYYHDGAYIAYPDSYNQAGSVSDDELGADEEYYEDEDQQLLEDSEDSSESSDNSGRPHNSSVDEIREAYFTALRQRYLSLRDLVRREPPDKVIDALPSTNPTEVEAFRGSSSTFTKWSGRLRQTDPLPAQIAAMHKDSIIRLLRIILGGKFLRRRVELRARTSTWIWALLARLPDRGELDYQEVGWVRDLGKRAVLLMIGLAEAKVLQEEYGVGGSDEEFGVDIEVDENLEDEISSEDAQNDKAENGSAAAPQVQSKDVCPNPDTPGAPGGADLHASKTTRSEAPDVNEDDDASMDLDDGEVSDHDLKGQNSTDLEAVKARLLADLDNEHDPGAETPPRNGSFDERAEEDASASAQTNAQATLNMILTVAGEFYGQRDLLEFRDPFGSF